VAMSDGRPFQLQYDSPIAKEVRTGEPASRGDNLKENPPAFNPKDFRTAFIKNSRTNPLDREGFDNPEPIISQAKKIGVTPNFGDFNNTLELLYADSKHLIFFGKNTLGQPDTKRLLGTLGNPNNNSIGISFFFFYYLFSDQRKKYIKFLFINLSLLLIVASQSRTGFYSVTLIFIYYVLAHCKTLHKKLIYVGFYILCFIIVSKLQEFETKISVTDSKNSIITLDKSHDVVKQMNDKNKGPKEITDVSGTKYLSSVDFEDMDQNTSINSRLEIWKLLFKMIKEKPIFGHGPQKNFFYEKHLYPENEYILNFWRYGLFGLIVYVLFYAIPIIGVFKKDKYTIDPNFYFFILLSITAITNLPMSEPRISILVAMSFGFLLNKYFITNEKKVTFS
jgi:hypothetical protein